MTGVDRSAHRPHLQTVAAIERVRRRPLNPGAGDLAVTAGWGIVQSRAVMPGAGQYDERERTDDDSPASPTRIASCSASRCSTSTSTTMRAGAAVPAAAWDFKIGGFQVLRKWLSYREQRASSGAT